MNPANIPPAPGPLGWIAPSMRDQIQQAAHAAVMAHMPKFSLTTVLPTAPINVRLFKFWSAPEVVAEVGYVFPRFHQLTGSCVGAGGGQALFTLGAVQRLIGENPTKAFMPWWPYNYGKSRLRMGSHSPGEGSMGSTFADSVVKDGIIDDTDQALPKYRHADGLELTSSIEMQWSDGDSQTVEKYDPAAIIHPVGTAAECRTVQDIKVGVVNGYPVTFACNNYVGHASIQGSGTDACAVGYWDTYGPHQQSIHAYWDHPTLGPLYWVQNNWPASVYPTDPAGGPVCGCWVKEAKVEAALRLDAEVFTFSHLTWFPAQIDKIINWSEM